MSAPRWLCLAHAFPPVNRSGTHRILQFVRHLDTWGWPAAVISAGGRHDVVDEALSDRLPPRTKVTRVVVPDPVDYLKSSIGRRFIRSSRDRRIMAGIHPPAMDPIVPDAVGRVQRLGGMRNWLSSWLRVPDTRLPWVFPALRAAGRIIRKHRPEVLFSTSPFASAHVAALILNVRYGIPWVADFRDPWCGNPFRSPLPRGPAACDRMLERWVMRRADFVVVTTTTLRDTLVDRFPGLALRCFVIPNGFDPESIQGLIPRSRGDTHDFILTHCGQFYGPRSPLPWFQALRIALARSAPASRTIRLQLIGPDTYGSIRLAQWADQCGVSRHVEIRGVLSHRETLEHALGSDALVLSGESGDGPAQQVPAKLYEYLALRRPIVATLPADSPARSILYEAGANALICDPGDVNALASAMEVMAGDAGRIPKGSWSGIEQFSRVHSAKRLMELFLRLTGERPSHRGRHRAARSIAGSWKRTLVSAEHDTLGAVSNVGSTEVSPVFDPRRPPKNASISPPPLAVESGGVMTTHAG